MNVSATSDDPLLTVRDLNVFRRQRHILKGVSCDARSGEVLALIGPNGSGKSTLLKTILKLLPRDSGSVLLGGRDVDTFQDRELARRMAYMAQETECRWPLDVARVVSLGRMPHQGSFRSLGKDDWAVVERVMKDVAIDGLANRTVSRLSGGERQRVLFARALATEPEILLADEPTSGLDPYHQIHLMELFRAQAKQGRTIIVVLHDLTLASRFADRLVLLKAGEVIAQGRPAEVLTPERLRDGYSIEAEAFERNGTHAVVPWSCTRN